MDKSENVSRSHCPTIPFDSLHKRYEDIKDHIYGTMKTIKDENSPY